MNPARIINTIKERRAVLFLGQQYLTHDGGANDFYSQIRSKYGLDYKSDCYDIIFEISKTEKDLSQIASWLGKITGHISEPAWLRSITHLPWIHVYTSAIDRSMGALFENDGQREIEKIYSKASLLRNKRSPKSLHLTYLFGSTDHVDSSDRPPMNKFVLNTRLIQEVEPLYRRIPEIATPLGLLLMEGYDVADWFKTERLHGLASLLGSQQIVIFNPSPALEKDDFIQDLIAHDKVVLMPGHLADILTPELAEPVIDPLEPEDETEANGVVIRVGERKMLIRQEMTRLISRFGTVLDERLTYPPVHQDPSQRYDSFRAFLASTHTYPKWEYFQRGLPFRRDFEYILKKRMHDLLDLNNNSASESPLILHGHPSTGKSIGLYSLALDLVKEQICAVVLIPKNFTELRDNEITDLDEFCQILEQLWLDEPVQGKSVIIWDGMQSELNYNKVLNKLRGRGRKVILLGSCYWVNEAAQKNKKNYIEASDKLSTKPIENDLPPENVRFQGYLKQSFLNEQYYHLAQNTLPKVEDTRNYLSLLYHFLPDARPNIQVAVQGQISRFSRFIITQYFHSSANRSEEDNQSTIRSVLEELNLFPTEVATPKIRIANDEISYPEFFIFLIAVCDQFGIKVPFEIIYRCFDNKHFCVEIYKQLTANGIIHEFVDLNNNISLGAKSSLEAKILIQSVGGQSQQMVYLSRLLRNISTSDITVSSTSNQPTADRSEQAYSEIHFAVDLLIRMKDRDHPSNFINYLYDIAKELRHIREQLEVLNPRLMLQEASMLREWVYKHHQSPWKTEETRVEVLRRAEAILIEAREVLDNVRSPLHHFIQVELAATQCFLSIQMSKDGAFQGKAFYQFQQANDLVRAINSLNPDSYEALDVMFWAIRDLVQYSNLNETQKAVLYAEAKDFLQLAEEEGANNFNKEKLQRRKLQLGETFHDYKLSDDAFEELRKEGSKKGYFIRASERLGDTRFTGSMSDEDMERVRKAYNYLQGARHEINSDFQCMYLLLRLQFIIYNGKPPFAGTHQSLRLTPQQWDNIAVMTNHLLTFDEKNIRPKLLYLKALAEFHQDRISNSIDTFRQLSEETDEMGFGRRRISYHHVVSNPDGTVRTYEGIVNLAATRNKQRGEIYIPDLNVRLRYSWHDFKYDLPVQSNVRDFCIAFNFIGPVAIARRVRDNLVGTEADTR